MNRESFLSSIVTKPLVLNSLLLAENEPTTSVTPLSLDDALKVIKKECPYGFLYEVASSGAKFLYRGENIGLGTGTSDDSDDVNSIKSDCARMNPKPDLLVPGTYDSDEALRYFHNLEEYLKDLEAFMNFGGRNVVLAKPSNGHIATPSIKEASKWGEPVSIWPLGKDLTYSFVRDRKDFYDNSVVKTDLQSIDDIAINADLALALKEGREVMFSTKAGSGSESSDFIAIPSKYDGEIRSRLFGI